MAYPPEGDDEREVTGATIYFYNEDGDDLREVETEDAPFLSDLERLFNVEIESADLK